MRKSLLCLAAAAALPVSIIASPVYASVTVNDQGIGFVDKPDVQAVLGSKLPSTITFTLQTFTSEQRTELCEDGTTAVYGSSSSYSYLVTSTPVLNKQSKLTSGWNLTGLIGRGGSGQGGGGCYPQAVVSVISDVTSSSKTLAVNGVALPITG
jgi:hypothetical protein